MDADSVRKIFEGDPNNPTIEAEEVIEVVYQGGPVVSIYTKSKYAQFHDEFSQIGPDIPVLKKLIGELEAEGYRLNLD